MGVFVFALPAIFTEKAFLAGAVFGTTLLEVVLFAAGAAAALRASFFAAFLDLAQRGRWCRHAAAQSLQADSKRYRGRQRTGSHWLKDEERRGILETAHALQPEIKCVVLDCGESKVAIEGVDLILGLVGPSKFLNAVGRLLTQKAGYANHVSIGQLRRVP
jgi:hypothetical protein